MISWRLTSQETFFSIAIMGKQFFLIAICFFPLINRCVNTLNPSLLGLFYSIFLFWSLITWTFDRGMICIGLKRFQKALELLYNVRHFYFFLRAFYTLRTFVLVLTQPKYLYQVVTAPMHQVNAIALEAYKKYILVSLIHNGQVRLCSLYFTFFVYLVFGHGSILHESESTVCF